MDSVSVAALHIAVDEKVTFSSKPKWALKLCLEVSEIYGFSTLFSQKNPCEGKVRKSPPDQDFLDFGTLDFGTLDGSL